jgi:hypothetical protein
MMPYKIEIYMENLVQEVNFLTVVLSHVWVTIYGVWIGNWIYWPLTSRNYK